MHKLLASPLVNVSLLTIFYALQIFVAKLGFLAGADLFTFSVQTIIVTAILLSIAILPRKIKKIKKLTPKILLWLLFLGALSSGVGAVTTNAGIQLTTAINAGFLLQFDIAITILLAWILLREKLDTAKIITLFAILLGTYLFTTKGQMLTPHVGDIFILIGATSFATASVLTRRVFRHNDVDPDISSLFRPIAALPVLLMAIAGASFYPESLQQSFTLNLLDFRHFFYVLLNSICVVGILIFLNRSLKIASASYTAMLAAAMPILVAILGTVFLQESLLPIQIVGAFLIVSAGFVTHILKVDKH
jgi:drug/metabolite transporter (DMT)-like permease